ncbi:hypothetical protein UlMin_009163 [Ulmus minor]
MGDLPKCSTGKRKISSEQEVVVPKEEVLDFELDDQTIIPNSFRDNNASSSGSKLRASLIAMGFLPALVDLAIEEKGEEDVDLLMETILAYTASEKSNSESSDSLDDLFDYEAVKSHPEVSPLLQPKEEPDLPDRANEEKRASLLMMNFRVNEVDFAIDKLGENAPIDQLVDFITAAQLAEQFENATDETDYVNEEKNEVNDETLFGTMDKSLQLLQMGFSENQVSVAIERAGAEAQISELVNSIFCVVTAKKCSVKNEHNLSDTSTNGSQDANNGSSSFAPEMEVFPRDPIKPDPFYTDLQSIDDNVNEISLGKRPKEEDIDPAPQFGRMSYEEIRRGKRPKQEYIDDSGSIRPWLKRNVNPQFTEFGLPKPINNKPRKSPTGLVAKPPYFFYGNVANVSPESWNKISKFLYDMDPEYANTHLFSALSRMEGYIHNLPTEDRFHIVPKSPMTIEEAMPHTQKWWPSWDPRKQLSCINSETNGVHLLCDRLGKMLTTSGGSLSPEQQREILHNCRVLNLVWIGPYKLGPMDPEHLESILGYPKSHTQSYSSLTERLQSLRYCYQTDILGYHLSVLKSMYPEGITLLSIFSGIGGAEVALHRLGIRLKGVVSVESSVTKRTILKRWWQSSRQSGELMQLEDVQRLTSRRLEDLIKKFGGFDLVICQNPCTQFSSSRGNPDANSITGFDFSLFCEFVRVLQRVRSMLVKR